MLTVDLVIDWLQTQLLESLVRCFKGLVLLAKRESCIVGSKMLVSGREECRWRNRSLLKRGRDTVESDSW